MAGELEAFGILANALALPYTIHQQNQQMQANRQMFASMLSPTTRQLMAGGGGQQVAAAGGPPGTLSDVGPTPGFGGGGGLGNLDPETERMLNYYTGGPTFPGYEAWTQQHPTASAPLRMIGNVGHVLQMVLGGGQAPRPPLQELSAIAKLREAQMKQQAFEKLPSIFKNKEAAALAGTGLPGSMGAAMRLEQGPTAHSDYDRWKMEPGNEGKHFSDFLTMKYEATHKPGVGGALSKHDLLVAQSLGIPTDRAPTAEEAQKIVEREKQMGFQAQPNREKDMEAEAERRVQAKLLQPEDVYEWKDKQRLSHDQQIKENAANIKLAHQQLAGPDRTTFQQLKILKETGAFMRSLLDDPEVRANRGMFWGRVADRLYSIGMDQGGPDPSKRPENDYIAVQNFVQILGTSAFIKGSRNFQYIGQIQRHLGAAQDEVGLLYSKLDLIDWYADEMTLNLLDSYVPLSGIKRPERRAQPGTPGGAAPAPGAGGGGAPDPVKGALFPGM